MEEKDIKVFNRKTEKQLLLAGNVSFDVKNRRIRLDVASAMMTGAVPGMYAHFLQIDKTFFLTVNNDQDGYKLHGIQEGNGLAMTNIRFIRHFFVTNNIRTEKITYSLIPSDGKEWKGSPMYEIFKKN